MPLGHRLFAMTPRWKALLTFLFSISPVHFSKPPITSVAPWLCVDWSRAVEMQLLHSVRWTVSVKRTYKWSWACHWHEPLLQDAIGNGSEAFKKIIYLQWCLWLPFMAVSLDNTEEKRRLGHWHYCIFDFRFTSLPKPYYVFFFNLKYFVSTYYCNKCNTKNRLSILLHLNWQRSLEMADKRQCFAGSAIIFSLFSVTTLTFISFWYRQCVNKTVLGRQKSGNWKAVVV